MWVQCMRKGFIVTYNCTLMYFVTLLVVLYYLDCWTSQTDTEIQFQLSLVYQPNLQTRQRKDFFMWCFCGWVVSSTYTHFAVWCELWRLAAFSGVGISIKYQCKVLRKGSLVIFSLSSHSTPHFVHFMFVLKLMLS